LVNNNGLQMIYILLLQPIWCLPHIVVLAALKERTLLSTMIKRPWIHHWIMFIINTAYTCWYSRLKNAAPSSYPNEKRSKNNKSYAGHSIIQPQPFHKVLIFHQFYCLKFNSKTITWLNSKLSVDASRTWSLIVYLVWSRKSSELITTQWCLVKAIYFVLLSLTGE